MSQAEAKAKPSPGAANDAPDLSAQIDALLQRQSRLFASGATLPLAFRLDQLRSLDSVIRRREKMILEALHDDLRKPKLEAYLSEPGSVLEEIKHTLRNLSGWMKPRKALSPLATAPSRGAVHYQPLGLNLILGAWNYPIGLTIGPAIGAIAAGNVAVIKPSELAPMASHAVAEIVAEAFDDEFVACVPGGIEVAQTLLTKRWDHVFFTGGTNVGRIVAKAAAEHLARVTLELGGKSPTIVMPSADLDVAAKRVVWGKFFNAGQTCIAPDYLLLHESIHDDFVSRMQSVMQEFFGANPQTSPDFARIVNERHFKRITGLIDPDKVVAGGDSDESDLYIAPTLMRDVTMDDRIMGEEIFGPVLPVVSISSLDDAIDLIGQRPNPLALYLFTRDKQDEHKVVQRVSFGGGCINNTLAHYGDPNLPFGGVGGSGTGAYHGKHSFEAFSHRKGVMKTGTFLDLAVKYPPYKGKLGTIKRVIG